jgi:hypothetical protein
VRREKEKEVEDRRTGSIEDDIERIQRRLDKGTEVQQNQLSYI